jgi:asparagine synthase (glutamine-hydrolysing)
MCGISGVFGVNGNLHPGMRSAVRSMNAALAHRGPDGDGFFDGDRAVFGHRRLAIIDRVGGRQPIPNEDESCWIVFNGEIYNYRPLHALLESKGHRFRTRSDSETILHAYEEYGPSCVEHLEGMFAFAIYDARRGELFAARDRLGKKPFFYTVLDGMFHFASELPALTCSPLWRGDIDRDGLEAYLSLGYFLAPKTIYKNVFKLPPASWLRIADGQLRVQQYWDVVEFDTDQRSDEELLSDIDATLRTAVHDRLESEVPLGAFLSGGIDSGLVVSYMAEALPGRLVTTSVGFGESEHNELAAAAMVASHFASDHHAEVVAPEPQEVLGPVMDRLGEPLADASAIPTWYVSRAARRHVTVALSGDGGDEGFAGYDFRYVPHRIEGQVRQWMPPGSSPVAGWLGERWPRSPRLPRPLRVRTLLQNLGTDAAGAYYADLTFMKLADTRALMGVPGGGVHDTETAAAITDAYRRCPSTDPVQKAEYADLKIYMPNDPLVKVDRMSMAHGLEVRCPLLDRRVIELAFRIPAARKQQGREGKALLRRLARRRLPAGVWALPKKGFTAPVSEWLAGPLNAAFRDDVLGNSALSAMIDVSELSKRLSAHENRRVDHSYALWAVWVLERWLRDAHRRHDGVAKYVQPAERSTRSATSGSFSLHRDGLVVDSQ